MKAHVITVLSVPESVEAAQRCQDSCRRFGLEAIVAAAVTSDQARDVFTANGWPMWAFLENRYSRPEPCMACFCSHAALWAECVISGKPLIVCEHDAVMVGPLPDLSGVQWLCNLGRPSFGTFRTPRLGIGPLVSKSHLPGAHAYYVTPRGARSLLIMAPSRACPTDVFISNDRFFGLEEAYPWPFECREEVSLIQRPLGCEAKHRAVRII